MYDIRELQEVAPCGCNKRLECADLKCVRWIEVRIKIYFYIFLLLDSEI
ncbi:unnamed protein product [Brassica rapa subsp. trilocularis]